MRRPLLVVTGQGVARADGFNLTRRMKGTRRLAALTADVRRRDRQNLDALLEACAAGGTDAIAEVLRDLRAICLKERRTTLRKTAHHEVFAALAAAAETRLVAHLTTNLDGLTTTFAVRDFGAVWPPFRGRATRDETVAALRAVIAQGAGMLHLPLHGEAALAIARGEDGERLQTVYGASAWPAPGGWIPSLEIFATAGVDAAERELLPARLGYALIDGLLDDAASTCEGLDVPARSAADLLVIGYGAEDDGTRPAYPFERRIADLVRRGARDPRSRWTALVYRPAQFPQTAAWYEAHGFTVVGYDDGELGAAVHQASCGTLPGARCAPVTNGTRVAGHESS
ncbi:MAG: hypothetical protein U0842_23690 [Candidatus Binatia bacterium]